MFWRTGWSRVLTKTATTTIAAAEAHTDRLLDSLGRWRSPVDSWTWFGPTRGPSGVLRLSRVTAAQFVYPKEAAPQFSRHLYLASTPGVGLRRRATGVCPSLGPSDGSGVPTAAFQAGLLDITALDHGLAC